MNVSLRFRRCIWAARLASMAVFLLASLVMIGWLHAVPGVPTFTHQYYLMKFNTALGFWMASLSLGFLTDDSGHRIFLRLAQASAVGVLLLGTTALAPYLFGRDIGIDHFLLNLLPAQDSASGRMSIWVACGFAATGLSLLLVRKDRTPFWSLVLATANTLLWSGMAVAYLYGLTSMYRFNVYGGISIPAIACFVFLNAGILLSRPDLGLVSLLTNTGSAGISSRRLFPAALLIPTLFGWLLMWSIEFAGMDVRISAAMQALSMSVVLIGLIIWNAGSVTHLEQQVATQQNEKMLALEKAAHLARYDVLTGLPNRALLQERLDIAVKIAARHRSRVALLFVDLDRFKPINDTYGHQVGDQVLIEVSKRLTACVRQTDTVARQGGDEFVVLLQDVAAVADVSHIADNILSTLTKPYLVDNNELFLSASIGISMCPDDSNEAQTLIEYADAAMYYAKSLGRANYQFFAAHISEYAMRRASIERQIRAALANDQFMLHYQPKINIRTGKLIGIEALLRFKPIISQPTYLPEEFIPIAEETGLIVQLGEWVLREACRQNHAWQEAGHIRIAISVNVSPVQFKNRNFVSVVRSALKDSGLAARYLELEITESTAMEDFDYSIATMRALQALGVALSIDDFGTGHSSLSYLKRFPINTLKIDQSFIRDLTINSDDAAITCAIINMAKNLNQNVIAEGVETAEQVAFLQDQGCDQGQGFYFSGPMSAAAFEKQFPVRGT